MHRSPVRHQYPRQCLLPLQVEFWSQFLDRSLDASVKPLYHPVGLWVVAGGPDGFDSHHLLKILHQLASEIRASIRQHLLWESNTYKEWYQGINDRISVGLLQWYGFRKPSSIINNDKHIPISGVRPGKKSNEVHPNSSEWLVDDWEWAEWYLPASFPFRRLLASRTAPAHPPHCCCHPWPVVEPLDLGECVVTPQVSSIHCRVTCFQHSIPVGLG